jgi:putative membrane protein
VVFEPTSVGGNRVASSPAAGLEERGARGAGLVLGLAAMDPSPATAGYALATFNAIMNGTSALLLASGFAAIRSGRPKLHRQLMLAAFGTSTLFLISYLTRVAIAGTHRFPGSGLSRAAYMALLGSHTVLAIAVVPLALRTAWLSLVKKRFEAHKRLGRLALPVWLYVSVTGVAVYWILYHSTAHG